MGWERWDGSQYYYREIRRGGRAISEYVGRGEFADLFSRWTKSSGQQNC